MAIPMVGATSEVSPEIVGCAFVSQFYHILHESPELVHRFFQDSSTMSRPGPDGTLKTVTAMKGIDDFMLSLDCKEYKAEILTADTQASHKDGVIVLVTGCLTGKDNVRRKFTESFFLAPQDKGYFVLNDAFRFVEEESLSLLNSVEEKEFDKNAPATPLMPAQETIEAPINQNAAVEVAIENKMEANDVPRNEQKSTVTEIAVPQAPIDSSIKVQPVVESCETLSNGHVDAPKKSYASLLKGMKQSISTTLALVPNSAAKDATPNVAQKPVASPAGQQSHQGVVPATASYSSASNSSNTNGSSADLAEDKSHSIYIGDLPWDARVELVEQEFKKFGRIKHNGIQVRSNKGYCFGFVEYEDAGGKQKAIEMGTIRIRGKEAFIQEKKTTTRVVDGVSTYPSGRGGFRNDGFRGRGYYPNGRGYTRNYYSKRNGDVPPRSIRNGDGYQGQGQGQGQGVYQNVVEEVPVKGACPSK